MAKANLIKQVMVTTKNEVGIFEEVTSALAGSGVNITGICAWGEDDTAKFALLTNDNAKTSEILKASGFEVSEENVVTIALEDKIGAAAAIGKKIKAAGIDLSCVYGTTSGGKKYACYPGSRRKRLPKAGLLS